MKSKRMTAEDLSPSSTTTRHLAVPPPVSGLPSPVLPSKETDPLRTLQAFFSILLLRACQAGIIGLVLVLFVESLGAAENCFPRGKSVWFVIPYSIGTLDNFYARMIKTVAEATIGSQFVPKNVPAKGGIEGMTELYRSIPSGRTLGVLNAVDAVVAALAQAVPFEVSQFNIFGRIVDTPHAVYVGRSTFAKGIKSIEDAALAQRTLSWGISRPGDFFAAVVLDDLFGIQGKFVRVRGPATAAAKAASRGEVDLVVLDPQSIDDTKDAAIIPILAVRPEASASRLEKQPVPLLEQVTPLENREKARSLARITASGLMIAGPPHIPGLRANCIQAGFRKALRGPNLRALAEAANKPVAPLNHSAAGALLRKAAQDAVPFKSIWLDALKKLGK